MKLLRYLKEVTLLKAVKTKAPNGSYIKTFTEIGTYKVQINNLEDEISATMYGADINNMLNISDALNELYTYLVLKVDNVEDNISLYYFKIGSSKYKIKAVKESGIIIERDGSIDTSMSL